MDVVDIWTGRHAVALMRALRLTTEGLAERLGTGVRTVAKWRADPELEPTPEIQQALDTLLQQAPAAVRTRFTLLLERDSQSPAPPLTGTDGARLLGEITASSTSAEAIEGLERARLAAAESHTQAPAAQMLSEVRQLHGQVQQLLQGHLRLSHRRELHRIEADLLAHACLLLGDLDDNNSADQVGAAAIAYAQEAGANPALGLTARAKTLRWLERHVESADLAHQGFRHSPATPVRIQLASQEANAAALMGDARRAREALSRAQTATETVEPDSGATAWSFPTPRQAIFALSVSTFTGDSSEALRAAAMADAAWQEGAPSVPANWAQIRVGAGIARLMQGDLDAAEAEVAPVFDLPVGLRVATVTAYTERLDRHLRHERFRRSPIAVDLREKLEEFTLAARQ